MKFGSKQQGVSIMLCTTDQSKHWVGRILRIWIWRRLRLKFRVMILKKRVLQRNLCFLLVSKKYFCVFPEKGRKLVMCCNMDKHWGHRVRWAKPVTKRQIPFEVSRIVKFIETESRRWLPGVGGVQNGWGELRNGYNVSILQGERVLEIGCITVWIY